MWLLLASLRGISLFYPRFLTFAFISVVCPCCIAPLCSQCGDLGCTPYCSMEFPHEVLSGIPSLPTPDKD